MKVRKMRKGENIYEYLQYANWAENAKRYLYPHFLWVAFRYNHGNHYFVKFDWDCWGESFYKRHGWCPVDAETRFEIQGEDEDIGIKLIWIPVSFKLFGYV